MVKKKNHIKYLSWPAQSPDLNPIENIWAFIEQELFNKRNKIKTVQDVWAQTRDIFHDLALTYIRKLYDSLPERLEFIIKAKGNRINY